MAAQESSLKSAKSLVKNDLQQHLIDNMEGNINNDSEWVIMAQPTTNDDPHTTLPLPIQSSKTSNSGSHQVGGDDPVSCTFKDVLRDHLVY